tara:strand:- start:489 stop:617 length:129 start_codon:yes stop_codon:yes gene_type:complete
MIFTSLEPFDKGEEAFLTLVIRICDYTFIATEKEISIGKKIH